MFSDNKGQASAEFIFITLIAMIVIGSIVGVIGSNQAKTQTGDVGSATIMGQKIAETINTVYINGPGYSITMNLSTLNQGMKVLLIHSLLLLSSVTVLEQVLLQLILILMSMLI